MSEEEMFADYGNTPYLTALYNIINSIRYQRQPFAEVRILVEGDVESENILNSMLIVDNKNPTYNMDYQRFLASMSGAGPVSVGGPGQVATGPSGGYY
jgi:hypothetical protein